MSLDPDRRAALVAAKAAALARRDLGASVDPATADALPGGSAGLVADDGRGIVLLGPGTGLGTALMWARRRGVPAAQVLTEGDAGVIARRAACFAPPPTVWAVEGTGLRAAAPAAFAPVAVPPPAADEWARVLRAEGVDVVVEQGIVRGEILGLEVARVLVRPDGEAVLEVGVGRHDREAFALLHDEVSPVEALRRVVGDVGAHRRPGAAPHAISRLVRERWLRDQVLADPGLVGARTLHRAEAPDARGGLHDTAVAVAVGPDRADGTVVVACSVGVDPELVPVAADARLRHAPDARLVLVVPPRDALAVTRDLAAALAHPAEVVPLDVAWPS